MAGVAIETLAGPRLAGDAFDLLGNDNLPIAVSAAFSLAAAGVVALMPEPAGATRTGCGRGG